jgi:hypothetical protein
VTGEYDERKEIYENLAANLESNMSKLEQASGFKYSYLTRA